MKITVISRQVKAGEELRQDFTGIEAAIRLKEKTDAEVWALVMGEETEAVKQVRDAIAMGADGGTALVPFFAEEVNGGAEQASGVADTWIFAEAFAAVLKERDFDLIISGGFPTDGDTVPQGLLTAALLGIPAYSHVDKAERAESGKALRVVRKLEDRSIALESELPCLLSALPHREAPIYKTMPGINRAYAAEIETLRVELRAEAGKLSLLGTSAAAVRKRGETLSAVSTEEAVNTITARIAARHLL